jgi:ABC-type Fe3+ transport system permease subunit
MKDQPDGKLHPIESKYMASAAVVGFLLTLPLTGGSLIAAFGVLALLGGIGWVAHRLLR